jgi:hypothetical protein
MRRHKSPLPGQPEHYFSRRNAAGEKERCAELPQGASVAAAAAGGRRRRQRQRALSISAPPPQTPHGAPPAVVSVWGEEGVEGEAGASGGGGGGGGGGMRLNPLAQRSRSSGAQQRPGAAGSGSFSQENPLRALRGAAPAAPPPAQHASEQPQARGCAVA